MLRLSLVVVSLSAFLAFPGVGFAQGFYFGPGDVRIDDGRGYYGERRYYEERRAGPPRGMCRELRRACMFKEELGEEGMGNCRRYRRLCT